MNLQALHVPDYTFLIQQLRLQQLLLPRGEGRRPKNLKSIFLFHRGLTPAAFLPQQAFVSPRGGDPCGDLNTHHKFRLQQSDILLSPVPSRRDDLNPHACADSTDAETTWVPPLLLVEPAHRARDPACLIVQVPACPRPAPHSSAPYTTANTSPEVHSCQRSEDQRQKILPRLQPEQRHTYWKSMTNEDPVEETGSTSSTGLFRPFIF